MGGGRREKREAAVSLIRGNSNFRNSLARFIAFRSMVEFRASRSIRSGSVAGMIISVHYRGGLGYFLWILMAATISVDHELDCVRNPFDWSDVCTCWEYSFKITHNRLIRLMNRDKGYLMCTNFQKWKVLWAFWAITSYICMNMAAKSNLSMINAHSIVW